MAIRNQNIDTPFKDELYSAFLKVGKDIGEGSFTMSFYAKYGKFSHNLNKTETKE